MVGRSVGSAPCVAAPPARSGPNWKFSSSFARQKKSDQSMTLFGLLGVLSIALVAGQLASLQHAALMTIYDETGADL
ncbi:MAG: hypothetical protein IV100_13015 [Myxococcales bacterium]|nr:hypothetical protein [Myxococcales bacterium]